MLKPDDVSNRLRKHFAEVTSEQFHENVERFTPNSIGNDRALEATSPQSSADCSRQLVLFQPPSASLPLEAYLACALSGLTEEQRQLVFHISDIVATVCHDQNIQLYEPRKKTDPVHHADVPDTDVYRVDRERVLSSDLLIHLCHYPSTGSGEELDFAYGALLPIVLISHSKTRVSRMVTGIPSLKLHISYTEPEELRHELRDRLMEIRPVLEERKLAFSQFDANLVGERIRNLREELGLTREDVASSVPHLTVDALRHIEESTDRISNPTLIHLRQIATILRTTVADLVEPDLSERLMNTLQEWASQRTDYAAARFHGINLKDRDRLIRRVLRRVIDLLDEE